MLLRKRRQGGSRGTARGDAERLDALPPLPRDEEGPVFAEPWQAQAFALAVKLSEQGYFTWKEWAGALAVELKAAADRGEPDDGSPYYNHWVATLERLVTAKGLADSPELDALQGGVGRRLSSHAARQTGGAPANGLNASIDEDL